MRTLADPSPGVIAARSRAAAMNLRIETQAAHEHECQMRRAAERRLNERAQADRARFAELATEQAMRAIGNEIGKRFAERLERLGVNPPAGMDARLAYHLAERVFCDNLNAGEIVSRFEKLVDRDLGQHHPLRGRLAQVLREVLDGVARSRMGSWMLPNEVQQWFHLLMEHAEAHVTPRVRYRPAPGDTLVAEQTIRVEVVWPRDVLAYDASLEG